MQDFVVHIPTRLLFGGSHRDEFIRQVAALGSRVLVVLGGGSIRRLGYLDPVLDELRAAGVEPVEFAGIEANPQAATIDRGAAVAREAGTNAVLAFGGGSVMDAAKAIAALRAHDETAVWPFVLGQPQAGQLTRALPLAAIPTTAATASEVTPYAVISNRHEKGKSVIAHDAFKPAVAWLNPAFTVDLPEATTCDGAADILSHVFENHLLGGGGSPLADGYSEAVMRVVVDTLPRLLSEPRDEALRGRLLWASTMALNGMQVAGRQPSEFVLHAMEHALSGFQPDLAHGRGLATLYPAYFRWLIDQERAVDRLARLGRVLFDLGSSGEDKATAHKFVGRMEQWLEANQLRQSLTDLGFDPADYAAIAAYCVKTYGDGQQLQALGPLTAYEIEQIFHACG